MNSLTANPNLATYMIGFIFVLLAFFTLWTLVVYFFSPRDPLRWNTEARIEAAQNPANLLTADREYRQQRRVIRILVVSFLAVVCYQVAPTQSRAVFDAVLGLLGEVFNALRTYVTTLMAARGG